MSAVQIPFSYHFGQLARDCRDNKVCQVEENIQFVDYQYKLERLHI